MLPESRLQLIAPSQWLASLVGQSFLYRYDVAVVRNSIDDGVFKPSPSAFRKDRGLEGSFVVLGVASVWSDRKGLDDFVRLADKLDERFAIVLVGLSKRQAKSVPERIVALPRTDSARRLAEIYTAADVLFNPTVEDNLPTVNLEAEACGTPVVTYDTGGCRETVRLSASRTVSSLDEAVEAFRALLDDSPMGFETRSQAQASGNEDER